MGGQGSGRHATGDRPFAQNCVKILVKDVRESAALKRELNRVSRSQRINQYRGFITSRDIGHPALEIERAIVRVEQVIQEVLLENTSPGKRGGRWWFRCRFIRDGSICNRRADKLYLCPNGKEFACRRCHQVTYRSPR